MKRSSTPNALPTGAGLDAALQRLRTLAGTRVTAGIQSGEEGDLAAIASANHYGTDRIPPRPWLSAAAENNRARWVRLAGAVVKARGSGGGTGEQQLRQLGVAMVGDCQESLLDGTWAPNAPLTIARKGSDQPLVDTGRLNQSHRAQVEMPGESPVPVA